MRACLPALLLLLPACVPTPGATGPARTSMQLAFDRLMPIDQAHGHYEAWAVAGDATRSLGKFVIGPAGRPTDLHGRPIPAWRADLPSEAVREVVVTQEGPGDADEAPSGQVFLRGAFDGRTAALAPPVRAADFTGREGGFMVENVSTDRDVTDRNGIWFGASSYEGVYLGDVMRPALQLDAAPPGWMWAGWTILDGHALRMGKFVRPDQMDDWYGYSGLAGFSLPLNPVGPPMPGEDFVKGLPAGLPIGPDQPDLAGAEVIVTLEDARLAHEEAWPSPLRIFEGAVPDAPARRTNYPLTNVAVRGLPGGTADLTP